METQTIPAIETYYNGITFRSKLEAKWARFFDLAGVRYIYEPEKIMLDKTGRGYIPDFYLPDHDFYVEIKPDRPGAALELLKPIYFVEQTRNACIILPNIPQLTAEEHGNLYYSAFWYNPLNHNVEDNRVLFTSLSDANHDVRLRIIGNWSMMLGETTYFPNWIRSMYGDWVDQSYPITPLRLDNLRRKTTHLLTPLRECEMYHQKYIKPLYNSSFEWYESVTDPDETVIKGWYAEAYHSSF